PNQALSVALDVEASNRFLAFERLARSIIESNTEIKQLAQVKLPEPFKPQDLFYTLAEEFARAGNIPFAMRAVDAIEEKGWQEVARERVVWVLAEAGRVAEIDHLM